MFSTAAMSALFSQQGHVRCMLLFEAALARAEASAGIIPQEAADAIATGCAEEFIDVEALYREAEKAGTPAIPLVRALTAHLEGEAQRYVHWGATSQDAIDTATMLQMREGIDLLARELLDICAKCAKLAEQHRRTPMAGRTLLQQALPITFGLKAARWLALVTRMVYELRGRERSLCVQLGGAAGTLASLGEKGLQVVELLAEELKLPVPDLPWHTERDRIAEVATTLGIVAGAMEKIARDVVLLAQSEVGEVLEGVEPGKGGSSAMPQKHNPVDATNAIAAARLAIGVMPTVVSGMAQEHERAVGGWQAEWVAVPDLFCSTAAAIEGVRRSVGGIQVDEERMRTNLESGGGLIMAEALTMALAVHVGRPEAYRIVQALCHQVMVSGGTLRQVAVGEERVSAILSSEEIERALRPEGYVGSTDQLISRALEAYRQLLVGLC